MTDDKQTTGPYDLPSRLEAEAAEWDDPMCSEHEVVPLLREAARRIRELTDSQSQATTAPRWVEQCLDLHDLMLGRIRLAQIAKGVASENWFYHLRFTEPGDRPSYSCPSLPEARAVCDDHARMVLKDRNDERANHH